MSYAGVCGSNNVQGSLDDYYHSGSLKFIYNFMRNGAGSTCGTKEDLGNHAPVVSLNYENGFYIPISTPFELEGSATDDENDQMTYAWEQRDSFISVQPLGMPFGRSPLFRALYPSEDGYYRSFPRIDRILNNTNHPTEVLPDYSRELNFVLIARDNHIEGGTSSEARVIFNATEEAGPFMVSSQNNFESHTAGDLITVEWDVANTNQAPVNTKAVRILLSTDNGANFDYVLANSTINDGSEEVFLPQIDSDRCRIKIKAVDNIFFDINDFEFTVEPATSPGFTLDVPETYADICLPNQLSFSVGAESFLGFDSPLDLSLENVPAEMIYSFDKDQIASDETTQLNLDFSNFNNTSSFFFDVVATDENQESLSKRIQLDITSTDYSSLNQQIIFAYLSLMFNDCYYLLKAILFYVRLKFDSENNLLIIKNILRKSPAIWKTGFSIYVIRRFNFLFMTTSCNCNCVVK